MSDFAGRVSLERAVYQRPTKPHPPFELKYTCAVAGPSRAGSDGGMGRFAVVFCWVIAQMLMSSPMSARAATVDWLLRRRRSGGESIAPKFARTAVRQALLVALKRITGLNEVPTNAAVIERARRAAAVLRRVPLSRSGQPGDRRHTARRYRCCRCGSRENPIRKLIADAGLPLWSSNRPTTLAWIAVNDRSEPIRARAPTTRVRC